MAMFMGGGGVNTPGLIYSKPPNQRLHFVLLRNGGGRKTGSITGAEQFHAGFVVVITLVSFI